MRKSKTSNGLTLRGIAGTHAVLLGWSMNKADSRGVLGFAVHRTDHTENEAYWLEGMKVFEETDPGTSKVSLRSHPVQGFTWSDFTAKPGHRYTYRVVALKGRPDSLHEEQSAAVTLETESPEAGAHGVWFNRGAAASQMWAARFGDKKPSQAGEAGFRWLSRGLNEALLAFIAQARGTRFGLRVAAYQFAEQPVLAALKQAADSGANVRIIYDARKSEVAGPNRKAVADAGIGIFCTERTVTPGPIMHNKFIVLLDRNKPVAVWTGSTNFTKGGIFGHSNVGHAVRSRAVAELYLKYWELLKMDLAAADMRTQVGALTPTPAAGSAPASGISVQFSPRKGIDLLKWYVEQAASAKSLLCSTFAFGVNKQFVPMFQKPFDGLRYALLDSPGNGSEAEQVVLSLRKLGFNRFAIGNFLARNMFDKWVREQLSGLNRHAQFIHTKFMLVDPLGADPVVITGSANFSDASTNANDENMLVIRGDRAVADIYLTEYMRLWNHYAFREWAAAQKPGSQARPQFLKPNDSWRGIYYGETEQARQRRIFAGTVN